MKFAIIKIISVLVSSAHLFLWFLRQILHEDLKNYIPYYKKDKPIIILGNGPSLTNFIESEEFDKIRNNNNFCVVNFSILSPLFQQLKPEFLTIADPLFFQRPINNEKIKLFKEVLLKVDWNFTLIIPFRFYKQIQKELINQTNITVIPIHTQVLSEKIKNLSFRNLIYKKGLSCPRIQNVVVASIYSMINYGYHHIYLYGVDHSWTTQLCVNTDNQVCLKDIHYYDNGKVELKPWLKGSGEPYKMHEVLRDLAYMFNSYHELQIYASYLGNIKIINNSPNSFIDAFDRG